VDLSVYKEFRVWGEHRILTVKFEAFNALNHFNPGNPNTSLAINFATGQNTNSLFGTIPSTASTSNGTQTGGAALPARHGVISVRFTF